jgi:hypothetical protein
MEMMKKLPMFEAPPIKAAGAILIAACWLGACTHLPSPPPAPVLKPIDVNDRTTTIPSARLSWYPQGSETGPGSRNFGVELEYAGGTGRSDQSLGSNQIVSLGGKNIQGPQEVQNHADLRYGHLAFTGSQRFWGRVSSLEVEWVAGLGRTELNLLSQSRAAGSAVLSAKYGLSGAALGVGPRWNITSEVALEGRLQLLHFWPFSNESFWYPEIALRYRPVKNVALRMGYSTMYFNPPKQNGEDSAARVYIRGPFLGLGFIF